MKGLLITIEAERKARIKSKDPHHAATTNISTAACPMDVDVDLDSHDVEALGVRELLNQGTGNNANSDEDGHKRKRSADSSIEVMRSGKRPSLTPPPLSTLPPPGMMNPEDVTDQELSQLVVFQDDRAMMLSVCTSWHGPMTNLSCMITTGS